MCRLISYLGKDITLSDVLVKPANSLVMQSLHAKESNTRTNGDGFGLGWYAPSISDEPALFTSVSPAWNDRNLLHLTNKIKSPVFFAHVRAATGGGVTQYNCHPFSHGKWMMMHNGGISDFKRVKRHLRRLLDDDLYGWLQGETDSEHLFALFLQNAKNRDLDDLDVVADVLEETIHQVLDLIKEYGDAKVKKASHFNVCLTDGKRLVATRYCSDKSSSARTLHYAEGQQFGLKQDLKKAGNKTIKPKYILVCSEKLSESDAHWRVVPSNHILLVTEEMKVSLRPFE